ncbi:MAG: hypothetical protein R3302_00015 [Sulfurimonadaceae bacterium]|nr:hypothetical protein [Sulfurimonadaceae bacterium]
MAKKRKAIVDLRNKEITFPIDERKAKVITYNPNTMTLVVDLFTNGTKTGSDRDFPFAHLPKSVKRLLKPLQ